MGVAHEAAEGFSGLSPHRVAVVMADFQNDFCSPEVFGGGPVQDLVSGQDRGDETDNKAVRDYLHLNRPEHAIESPDEVLIRWRARAGQAQRH